MSLNHFKGPKNGVEAFRRQSALLLPDRGFLSGLRGDQLTPLAPHRTFVIRESALDAEHVLSASKSLYWRYLLRFKSEIVGEVEFTGAGNAGEVHVAGISDTPFAKATVTALKKARKWAATKKDNYEFRYLKIPWARVAAVWLHGKEDDLILPLPPTRGSLVAYRIYPASHFIRFLKNLRRRT